MSSKPSEEVFYRQGDPQCQMLPSHLSGRLTNDHWFQQQRVQELGKRSGDRAKIILLSLVSSLCYKKKVRNKTVTGRKTGPTDGFFKA